MAKIVICVSRTTLKNIMRIALEENKAIGEVCNDIIEKGSRRKHVNKYSHFSNVDPKNLVDNQEVLIEDVEVRQTQ